MKLRTVDVVILLLLAMLCIARATWGLFKDVYVNLPDARAVTGKVIYASIDQVEEATFRSRQYATVFVIRLDNSNQHFAIKRGSDVCKYLEDNIRVGDTISLLYRLSTADDNSFVFQVEKGSKVLAGYSDYRKKEIKMIVLAYTIGSLILAVLFTWYIRKKRQNVNHP
ncbi:hypothetical protein [Ferruginibacter sp.]